MPSTFTNNAGIELPADGEKDGVWGDVTNLNMQIIDRLTNGVGAVSLTGTTHTLTTANGVLSDGQYALVVFGGTPSGTNTVTIVPNDAEKTYLIRNTTSEDVVITQGSGGNATVSAGSSAIVYANGAGTGAAVVDLTATFVPDLAQAGVTASTAELNILDGVTATTAELNTLDGVTSAIQTQIDTKQVTITGGATTIVSDDLAVSRALVSDGSGKVAVSDVTAAELAVLDGITATVTELNILDGVTATAAELNILDGVTATATELNHSVGVTSDIQTQIDNITTVPSGAVFHFAMSAAPSGYLKANGAAVSRTTYAALFAAIGTTFGTGDGSTTFNVPDLRGEFVRGLDDGRGVDAGRALGSAQTDEFESHNHLLFRNTGGAGGSTNSVPSYSAVGLTGEATGAASYGGGALAQATGGTETRPRNIALLACIKV